MYIVRGVFFLFLGTACGLFCANYAKQWREVFSYSFIICDTASQDSPPKLNLLSSDLKGATDKEKIEHAHKLLSDFVVDKPLVLAATVCCYSQGGGHPATFSSGRNEISLLPGSEHAQANQKLIAERISGLCFIAQEAANSVPESPVAQSSTAPSPALPSAAAAVAAKK